MATKQTLSLNQIQKATGISMPTLIKYKKQEIKASLKPFVVGEGRNTRFTKGAVKVFRILRDAGLKRRGRPAKNA